MNGTSNIKNQISLSRIIVFGVILILVFLVFLGRLLYIQIINSEEWIAKAQENNTQKFNLQALRGIIYDRNETILAQNVAAYSVTITAADLPDDQGATQEIFRELSELIDLPVNLGDLQEEPYVPCISEHGIAQIAEYG